MLVKTLLCREGRDTGLRLMAIVFAAFALLSIAALVFPASIIILIATVVSLPIVGLSAMRRLHDANKTITLMLVCLLPVLIFGVAAYFEAPLGVLAGVFLFGLACGGYLSFLPTKNHIQYALGYYGPHRVMNSAQSAMHRRQDPVMQGQAVNVSIIDNPPVNQPVNPQMAKHDAYTDDVEPIHNLKHDESFISQEFDVADEHEAVSSNLSAKRERNNQPLYVDQDALQSGSITELAKSWINLAKLHQQKLLFAGKILAAVIALGLLIYLVIALINAFSSIDDSDTEAEMSQGVIEPVSMSRQMVKLPDGFWLALEGDVLILRWLGDAGDTQNLWRLASAVGDKTCAELEFNDGSKFRPITVDLLADGATEARFTPLDKNVMVNNIALRGDFKLCGYKFSLKGSQAALMKNPQFETLLSQ
ncbi:MAG: DUF805 domain-containing protein [Shewanella sp.]|uniref:hypothetical protein n=1 Tax=Shewanella sp. TaxID=50422 RepID=UPI003567FFDC